MSLELFENKLKKYLTDNRNATIIYDSTGQQMKVELHTLNNNCMASIVTALQIKRISLVLFIVFKNHKIVYIQHDVS